nr:hypothetical protein [Tanacetum cinerariifolium]
MIRGSQMVSDTVLKHDVCELVIAEVRFAITNDGTRVPNLAKRDFKNFQTTRASLVGSTFALTHFDKLWANKIQSQTPFWRCSSGHDVPGGSIVASLENVNGFPTVNTPPDDLIRTDFKQEGVIPKVMLHIFEEFVLLLGRHSLNNEIPRMVVCKVGEPWGRAHFGEGFLIEKDDRRLGFHTFFGEEEYGIFLKKTGHRLGYLRKVLYESSIEANMTEKATDTLDGSGMM